MSRQLTTPTADTQLYAVDSQGGSPPQLAPTAIANAIRNRR